MYAIRQYTFGGPEVLRYEQVDDPAPGPGQVRIAVEAAGVHRLDTHIRAGEASGPFPLPDLPMTPGREVAGVVDALGPDTDRTWLGRRVVTHLGQASGGYASMAVADAGRLYPIPDGLDAAAAVATIGTGRTAVAILEQAGPKPYDVVVVPAAAGGLGLLLVQAAHRVGAAIVGLAGNPVKLELVRAAGADLALGYDGWADVVRDRFDSADLLLDGVGGEVGRTGVDLLRPGGRAVVFGWSSGTPTDPDLRADVTVERLDGAQIMARLPELEATALRAAADGTLEPHVGQRFALRDAAAAHVAVAGRDTTGKTVLIP